MLSPVLAHNSDELASIIHKTPAAKMSRVTCIDGPRIEMVTNRGN
jgi:hypothetical protein